MGKSISLDINGEDIDELVVEDPKEELTMEEPAESRVNSRRYCKEHSVEEEEDKKEVSSAVIKPITEKWDECHSFFEKHSPMQL